MQGENIVQRISRWWDIIHNKKIACEKILAGQGENRFKKEQVDIPMKIGLECLCVLIFKNRRMLC